MPTKTEVNVNLKWELKTFLLLLSLRIITVGECVCVCLCVMFFYFVFVLFSPLKHHKILRLVFTYYFSVRTFRCCASGIFEQLAKCLTNESWIVFLPGNTIQILWLLVAADSLFSLCFCEWREEKKIVVWISTMKQKILIFNSYLQRRGHKITMTLCYLFFIRSFFFSRLFKTFSFSGKEKTIKLNMGARGIVLEGKWTDEYLRLHESCCKKLL